MSGEHIHVPHRSRTRPFRDVQRAPMLLGLGLVRTPGNLRDRADAVNPLVAAHQPRACEASTSASRSGWLIMTL